MSTRHRFILTIVAGASAGAVAGEDVLRELIRTLAPYLVDQVLVVVRVLSADVSVLRAVIWVNALLATVLIARAPSSAYSQSLIAYCAALTLHAAVLALADNPVPLNAGGGGPTREAGYLLMSSSLQYAVWLREGRTARSPMMQLIALALGVSVLVTDRAHYPSVCCAVSAFGVLCATDFLWAFRDLLSRSARLSLGGYALALMARPALFDNQAVEAATAYGLLMLLKYPALFSIVRLQRVQARRRSAVDGESEVEDDSLLRETCALTVAVLRGAERDCQE